MRVKVSYNSVGLIIPIENPSEKVERLLKTITERFENHGIEPGQLRIAEIQTADGFLLAPNDKVEDVIENGERLLALGYKEWMNKHASLCTTSWISVISEDFVDKVEKWVIAGLHEHNKIFIKFGINHPNSKNAQLQRLELFDPASLQDFAKEGKSLVGSISDDENTWSAEAYFNIVKSATNGFVVKEIELSVKTQSDKRSTIKKIPIQIGRRLTKVGEPINVQESADKYDPTLYTTPKGSSTGPHLPDVSPNPSKLTLDPADNSVETEALLVQQNGKVQADQSWESEGSFNNMIISTFKVSNRTENKIAVTKVTSEYQDASGKWITLPTFLGYNNWNWREASQFTMDPLYQEEVQTRINIKIEAPQWDKVRRAHKSLPQPLNIRTTFEDSKGGHAVITTQQVNGPLDLVTRTARQERNNDSPIVFWAQCDDTELEARIFAQVAIAKENNYMEVAINSSSTNWLYPSTLRKYAFEASQAKQSEWPISELSETHKQGPSTKTSALIDLERGFVYALKFELTTTTSSVVDYFPIPKLTGK